MNKNSLADRMKGYENISRIYLTKRNPVIIRVDGKSFHTFTKGFIRPFDGVLMETMAETAKYLCENVSGCKLAFVQSDEISLLITDYDTKDTQPWFENNLQKLVSISASMATLAFNRIFSEKAQSVLNSPDPANDNKKYSAALRSAISKGAVFDSRAFILPKEEVCNYFVWRQQDATRNSILMVAQSCFSHEEIKGIKCDTLQDKLFRERNINWNDCTIPQKRGTCVIKRLVERNGVMRHKWVIDNEIPIFTKDVSYINELVYVNTD